MIRYSRQLLFSVVMFLFCYVCNQFIRVFLAFGTAEVRRMLSSLSFVPVCLSKGEVVAEQATNNLNKHTFDAASMKL